MRIDVDEEGFEQLPRQVGFQNHLVAVTEVLVTRAKALAPDDPATHGDDYRSGIKLVRRIPRVYLSATDWKSHFIEWGTGEPGPTPTFATLRRTVKEFGMRLREDAPRAANTLARELDI